RSTTWIFNTVLGDAFAAGVRIVATPVGAVPETEAVYGIILMLIAHLVEGTEPPDRWRTFCILEIVGTIAGAIVGAVWAFTAIFDRGRCGLPVVGSAAWFALVAMLEEHPRPARM